jgi:hypothetical protein
MIIKELSHDTVKKIGKLFFPNIEEWEIYDKGKLSEETKWNGIDIVPKGWEPRKNGEEQPLSCIQISLDENEGFFKSIMVYDELAGGDLNLTGLKEMDELQKILVELD